MKKYVAEFIGTFTLVLFGCGTAVVSGQDVGHLGIAFAFGFALIAMAYGIGPVSGCHINPAVSLGVFTAGRMTGKDLVGYMVGQFLGGLAAAGVLAVIAQWHAERIQRYRQWLGSKWLGRWLPGRLFAFCRHGLRIRCDPAFCHRHSRVNAGWSTHADGRIGDRNHPGGDPHFRNQHHGSLRQPCPQSGPRAVGRRQSPLAIWMFLIVPSIAGVVSGVIFRTKVLDM